MFCLAKSEYVTLFLGRILASNFTGMCSDFDNCELAQLR